MFLKGRSCRSGKSDSVVKHEASDFHNLASRRQSAVGESLAEKAQQTLNAAAYEKMRVLFNIVHSLAKNNRPMSDFIFQRKLHEVNAQMSLGVTYNSVTEATYFLGYIALEAFQKLAETVNDSKFVSLTGDDSTDVSATEQSLWFVRTVKQGHIQVHLLGSTALEKADAEGIVNGLRNVVKQNLDCSLDKLMQKVASTTTDGASVMLGKKSGVCVRLRELCPGGSMLILHCMAHRLELAYKDACKGISLYAKGLHPLAVALYYFYMNSPLNRANLRRASNVLDSEVQHINVRGSKGMLK